MNTSPTGRSEGRAAFERRLGELRPKLHRYCARMTGSVIDGEDVVQEALMKALQALPRSGPVGNLEGWLFRIAHNAALDHLRRRARREALHADASPDMIRDPATPVSDRQAAAAGLRTFMALPVAERSAVILMDVLGYSLAEIGAGMEVSIPSVKAALHRGRVRLRELAAEPDERPPPILAPGERALLDAYVERFNARDFDAVRDMLAEEVRLDLVGKERRAGRRAVAGYFENYRLIGDWRLAPGLVEGRPAALVSDPADPVGQPLYFVLLGWDAAGLLEIRDFRYARYAIEGADVVVMA